MRDVTTSLNIVRSIKGGVTIGPLLLPVTSSSPRLAMSSVNSTKPRLQQTSLSFSDGGTSRSRYTNTSLHRVATIDMRAKCRLWLRKNERCIYQRVSGAYRSTPCQGYALFHVLALLSVRLTLFGLQYQNQSPDKYPKKRR